MAIEIKQYNKKWRIEIQSEEWEFENRISMEKGLKILLDLKEKRGQVKK